MSGLIISSHPESGPQIRSLGRGGTRAGATGKFNTQELPLGQHFQLR